MKAYNLYGINDLRYEDQPLPTCHPGWAVVKVRAAGICSSDIPRILTKGTYHFPTIPGHEFSGEVYRIGDENYSDLIGKRVGVFPLIPCKKCSQCEKKHYEMCEHYDYIGSRRNGGFAEYVAVPIWNLVLLPDSMPFVSAAMLEPLSVALHAIKMGDVRPGSHVAVIGTGMIGISAAQWAGVFGAKQVTVIGRNESKREIVEKCGITYKSYSETEETELFEFVLEAVGTPDAIERAIQMAAPGGTVLLMGNPSGDIVLQQNVYWRILRKQLTLKGTWNSSYDGINKSDWMEAVQSISNNQIIVEPLVSHCFSQEKLVDGLRLMYEHKEPYCKVMTLWNENNSENA